MKPNNYGSPSEEHACRATKRKHSVVVEEFDQHNHSKKRRTTVSRAVNLSRKPDPSRSLSHSNRFEVIHSTKKRRGRRKRKTSSAEDGHRQWVFSSRDFSNFKRIHLEPSLVYNFFNLGKFKLSSECFWFLERGFNCCR